MDTEYNPNYGDYILRGIQAIFMVIAVVVVAPIALPLWAIGYVVHKYVWPITEADNEPDPPGAWG